MAYLKQRELQTLDELRKKLLDKDAEKDAFLKQKLTEVGKLESKLRLKATELQKRETKLVQYEDELQHKIQEMGRQMSNEQKRDDHKQLLRCKKQLEETEEKFRALKRELDESPLAVLRSEIGAKNLQVVETESKLARAEEEKALLRGQYEKAKAEIARLKRVIDKNKEAAYQRQGQELEKLKLELRNKTLAEEEREELRALKKQLTTLQKAKTGGGSLTRVEESKGETLNARDPVSAASGFRVAPGFS